MFEINSRHMANAAVLGGVAMVLTKRGSAALTMAAIGYVSSYVAEKFVVSKNVISV